MPLTQASKGVLSIDVHGTAAANALPATPPEGQGGVQLVLDPDQRIEDHGSSLIEIQGVLLHTRLLGRCVGVPAVDLEGLHARVLRRGVADRSHGASKQSRAEGRLEGRAKGPG